MRVAHADGRSTPAQAVGVLPGGAVSRAPAAEPVAEKAAPSAHGAERKKKGYTRRTVLATSLAGGAAAGALRWLLLDKPGTLPGLGSHLGYDKEPRFRRGHPAIAGPLDAAHAKPWSLDQVVVSSGPVAPPSISEPLRISQLLRRFTFGATDAEWAAAMSAGYAATVDRLINTPPQQPPPFPGENQVQKAAIDLNKLQEWWINWMIASPTPFAERMTLFMSGLYTSDYNKVGLDNPFLIWQNRTWRDFATSDLRTILMRVSVDPAMLVFLDGNRSDGRPNAIPNQNYARELMELFSIGLNYSEADVLAGAKALSGWRVPGAQDNSKTGIFDPQRHFSGPLTFLGRAGSFDLAATVDAILANPNCAPFIAGKVVQEFVTPSPDPAYVDRLAKSFRASGYQMKTLLRDVLMSPEFGYQSNWRALVKSPLDYMVGAARALQAGTMLTPTIRQYARQMGHAPFDPPDVGGYPKNVAWASPINLIARVNFSTAAMSLLKAPPASSNAVSRHLDGVLSPGAQEMLAQAGNEAGKWWAILASPDAQLA
jgi:uncharacterized protein (DUF1800 family)